MWGAGPPPQPVAGPQVSRISVGHTAFGHLAWRVVRSRAGFVLRGWLKMSSTLVRDKSRRAGGGRAGPASPRRSRFDAGGGPLREPTPATLGVPFGGGFVSQNRFVAAN